ncbi:hypothetical protein DL98DRAFT_592870 [Cadophora sp. DSE1049]|nr:hypothetical protein DL98DRAFT_592870 [Cadophora sp. DSE1049]
MPNDIQDVICTIGHQFGDAEVQRNLSSSAGTRQDTILSLEQQIISLNFSLLSLEIPVPSQQIVEQNLGHALEQFTPNRQ